MSENIVTNLKVRFGADTKQFKDGVAQSNAAMKKFSEQGSKSFNNLANIIDEQTGGIISSMRNAGSSISMLGTAYEGAATSSGVLSKAMNILKVAIASTGIGALVVALGSIYLYFTKSSEGAYKLKTAMALINAVVSVFVDKLIEMGGNLVNFFGNVGSLLKAVFTGDLTNAKKIATDIIDGFKNIDIGAGIKQMLSDIESEGKAAIRIQQQLNALDKREIEAQIQNSEKKAKIAEYIRKSQDEEKYTAKQRLQYILAAQKLQKQINAEIIDIEAQKVRLMKESQALGENSIQDNKDLAAEIENLNNVKSTAADKERRLLSLYKSVNNEMNKQKELINKNRDENIVPTVEPVKLTSSPLTPPVIAVPEVDTSNLDKTQSKLVDFSKASAQITSQINSTFEGVAVSFFEFTGQLMAGTGDFETFGSKVLETFADLAVKVGKIAVGVGFGTLGIKKALETINPWVAIAAGGALIALGSAAKAGLANAAKGATGGSASNYNTTNAIRQNTAKSDVNIHGEFKIAGKDLALVLNKENYRVQKST